MSLSRLPAEHVTQIKSVSSHLKIQIKGLCFPTSDFGLEMYSSISNQVREETPHRCAFFLDCSSFQVDIQVDNQE